MISTTIDNAILYNSDCLDFLKTVQNETVDLVLIDPPYNINHNSKWDKWKKQTNYIEWLGSVFLECQRVLKNNGRFYFWHNDFQQMAELQHWIFQNTRFVFNSIISWIKPNFRTIAWKNKQESSNLRSWFNIQEYCLYYTFENKETELKDIQDRKDCFSSIKEYMQEEKRKLNLTEKELFYLIYGYNTKRSKLHLWNNYSQWAFPTEKNYKKLQTTGFFQKPYEELRAKYEELRAKYEELRPSFNIQNGKDYNNVWYSKTHDTFGRRKLHSCEKPQDLLQKIILTSSNENDIVLDCFFGSGSTALACLQTNRKFIGCEQEETYYNNAIERLKDWRNDLIRQEKWLTDRGVTDFDNDAITENNEKINLDLFD